MKKDQSGRAERLLTPARLDRPLFRLALTHGSYASDHQLPEQNERLEFLGDAVLELVSSDYLYHRFPRAPEGYLTRLRAALVCEAALADLAREQGVGEALRLGRGEEMTGGRNRPSILADAFEALLGALYLSDGLEAVRRLLHPAWDALLAEDPDDLLQGDSKTRLQEAARRLNLEVEYQLLTATGPIHEREYEVAVTIGGNMAGKGIGKSKKAAEQAAAREALQASVFTSPPGSPG